MNEEEKRIRGKDWGKALLCSILLLALLLFLLWPRIGGAGFGGGSGFGFSGNGLGGLGSAFGIGEGHGTGTGDGGNEDGGESSGQAAGGQSSQENAGSESASDSETRFGSAADGNESSSSPDGTDESSAGGSEDGSTATGEGETAVADPRANQRARPGNETLALIQPDSAPPATTDQGNRYVGGSGNAGRSGGSTAGRNIGGMSVRGERLGVVLDISGSMEPYLDELRAEIRRQFSSAVFLEVSGCSLRPSRFDAQEFREDPPEDAKRGGVMDAFQELVQLHGVDSIYWFCDLQDARNEKALAELRSLVWGKEMPPLELEETPNRPSGFGGLDQLEEIQKNVSTREAGDAAVHLYVRSTDEFPDSILQRIIEESGGRFQKKQ